jgi:lysophospholipase L1-like esterase
MKIITILGDSLALPRPEVRYTDTYPVRLSLLMGNEFMVVSRARRNNTVMEQCLLTGKGYAVEEVVYMYETRYFIIHLGIVDCAPRLFSLNEQRFFSALSELPYGIYANNIRRPIIKLKSSHRRFFTKRFPKVYVNKDAFAGGLSSLLNTIETKTLAKKVLIINIADTNSENKYRSFGFGENIRNYNEIIHAVSRSHSNQVKVIDIYTETAKNSHLLLPDGIHFSAKGHEVIADYIYRDISKGEVA